MRDACRSPAVSPVKWGQHFLSFELFSSDPAILARAETIFRPWRRRGPGKTLRRWFVEPVRSDGRWQVRSDTGANVLFGNTPEHALTIVEFLAVEALIESDDTALSLHGALVEKDGRAAVILGRGEAGKSTLTCALWQRGWTPLCDDITLVEPETVPPTPRPGGYPFDTPAVPYWEKSCGPASWQHPPVSSTATGTFFTRTRFMRKNHPPLRSRLR